MKITNTMNENFQNYCIIGRDAAKAGLWTTMDWTVDWTADLPSLKHSQAFDLNLKLSSSWANRKH